MLLLSSHCTEIDVANKLGFKTSNDSNNMRSSKHKNTQRYRSKKIVKISLRVNGSSGIRTSFRGGLTQRTRDPNQSLGTISREKWEMKDFSQRKRKEGSKAVDLLEEGFSRTLQQKTPASGPPKKKLKFSKT